MPAHTSVRALALALIVALLAWFIAPRCKEKVIGHGRSLVLIRASFFLG
jgi:hypothetical protein